MESLFLYIQTHLPFLIEYKYLFFFLGAMVEGFSTMVLGGFLASSISGINVAALFLALVSGYILNGFMWYLVGLVGGATALDKWGHNHHVSHEVIEKVTEYFDRHSGKAIILSKFTFGFTIAIMIMAGSLKYSLRRFFIYNSIGSLGWAGLTMGVGYFFGESLKVFMDYIKNFTLFLVALGAAIAVVYLIKLVLKKYFKFEISFEDKLYKVKEWMTFNVDNNFDEKDDKKL